MIVLQSMMESFKSEDGDTNLISIIIVLGIVLALVALFQGFIRNDIIGKIEESVHSFKNGF